MTVRTSPPQRSSASSASLMGAASSGTVVRHHVREVEDAAAGEVHEQRELLQQVIRHADDLGLAADDLLVGVHLERLPGDAGRARPGPAPPSTCTAWRIVTGRPISSSATSTPRPLVSWRIELDGVRVGSVDRDRAEAGRQHQLVTVDVHRVHLGRARVPSPAGSRTCQARLRRTRPPSRPAAAAPSAGHGTRSTTSTS